MSESERRDVDLTVAAEQSSEEGDALEWEDADPETAEHQAIHVEDDNADDDDRSGSDVDEELVVQEDALDPEADAVVADAIDLDSVAENDAAVEGLLRRGGGAIEAVATDLASVPGLDAKVRRTVRGIQMSPALTGTDGFYVATMTRKS